MSIHVHAHALLYLNRDDGLLDAPRELASRNRPDVDVVLALVLMRCEIQRLLTPLLDVVAAGLAVHRDELPPRLVVGGVLGRVVACVHNRIARVRVPPVAFAFRGCVGGKRSASAE